MALLDEDEIGYCRTEGDNDIDLQAVYGGRMSGRKQKDLKENPIYNDLNHIEAYTEMTGNMDSLRVVTYETFPKERMQENGHLQNGDVAHNKSDTDNERDTNGIVNDAEHKTESKHDNDDDDNDIPVYSQPDINVKKIGNPEHLKPENPNIDSKDGINVEEEVNSVSKTKEVTDSDADKSSSKGYLDNYGLLGYNRNGYEIDSIYIEIEERTVDDVDNSETDIADDVKAKNKTNETQHGDNAVDLGGNEQESNNQRLDNQSPNDSPCISHKEIVTEVLVHSSAVSEAGSYTSSKMLEDFMCHSFDSDLIPSIMSTLPKDNNSDWPDIDSLVRKNGEHVRTCEYREDNNGANVESPHHVRSISDVVLVDKNVEANAESDHKIPKTFPEETETSSMYKKNKKKVKSNSQNASVNEASSSTRTLKSILTTSTGTSLCSCPSDCEERRHRSESEIQELKSVKFSEDTVFNENKSGKYKKEKFKYINLRELYRGKISSDSAIAKMNPLFLNDDDVPGIDLGETNGSLTPSEKLAYQLTLRNAMKLSKENPGNLNGPSYLEQYLILKAHGLRPDNVDVEQLPETMETPAYDRLIERTLAKERRKICVKWSFVIIIVTVITAVATTLGVYFKQGF